MTPNTSDSPDAIRKMNIAVVRPPRNCPNSNDTSAIPQKPLIRPATWSLKARELSMHARQVSIPYVRAAKDDGSKYGVSIGPALPQREGEGCPALVRKRLR